MSSHAHIFFIGTNIQVMNTKPNKNGHGGARKGAGRKPSTTIRNNLVLELQDYDIEQLSLEAEELKIEDFDTDLILLDDESLDIEPLLCPHCGGEL